MVLLAKQVTLQRGHPQHYELVLVLMQISLFLGGGHLILVNELISLIKKPFFRIHCKKRVKQIALRVSRKYPELSPEQCYEQARQVWNRFRDLKINRIKEEIKRVENGEVDY